MRNDQTQGRRGTKYEKFSAFKHFVSTRNEDTSCLSSSVDVCGWILRVRKNRDLVRLENDD